MFEDRIVFVSALSTEPANKEGYTTLSGFLEHGIKSAAVRVNIQPATPELTMFSEGEMFKTFKAFTRTSGVVEGMRLTVSGTNDVYVVKGREKFDYGVGQHYELVLIKDGR